MTIGEEKGMMLAQVASGPPGILDDHGHNNKRKDDRQGDRQHQGLRFLRIFIDSAADGGEERGIEEIAPDEIEKEAEDDQSHIGVNNKGA